MVVVKVPGLPGNRLIFASTGPVNRDYDDIRRFSDAASNGIKRSAMAGIFLFSSLPFRASHLWFKCFFPFLTSRALKAGMQRPLFVCPPHKDYKNSSLVAALGALQALYMVKKKKKIQSYSAVWMVFEFGLASNNVLILLFFLFFHKSPWRLERPI